MKISNLKLQNYKGFQDLDLDFPDQNLLVFIGENGAGKSTILDALNKLLSELDYNLNGNKRMHFSTDDINIEASSVAGKIAFISPKKINLYWGFDRSKEINTNPVVRYYSPEGKILLSKSKEIFLKKIKESFEQTTINSNQPIILYFDSGYRPNADDFINWYKELVLFESYLKSSDKQFEYSLKEAVEVAIKKFTGILMRATIDDNFKTIKPVFQKDGVDLDFSNLSDGEKRVISIVGRIVSYFVTSFKSSRKKLLEFPGIVLIDEIEQHLHPLWQRNILPELIKTFPKVQFIVTTHSAQVVSNVARENIMIIDKFKLQSEVPHTLGRDANSILYDLFKLTKRPERYQEKINKVYELLDNGDIYNAKTQLNMLSKDLGENDIEIKRIQTQIELLD